MIAQRLFTTWTKMEEKKKQQQQKKKKEKKKKKKKEEQGEQGDAAEMKGSRRMGLRRRSSLEEREMLEDNGLVGEMNASPVRAFTLQPLLKLPRTLAEGRRSSKGIATESLI